jgi:heme-degrading monooxygenase HmoA
MFVSIRRYTVGAGQRDEVVRRVDENWTDQLRQQPGFQAYYVVASGEDELISFTACEDSKTLSVAVEKSAEWVGGHLMELDVNLQEEWRGQVVSHLGG